MPRTEEQNKEIRENKRSVIMQAAVELFANEGFHSTSISQIAQKAGISKGLIYNYFESKEELVKEIFLEGMEQLFSLFDSDKDGVLTNEVFVYFVNEVFNSLESNLNYWKLYFTLIMQPPVMKLVDQKLMELMEPLMKTLYDYYARKGRKNPEVDTRLFAAIIDGIGFHYILDPENFPMEEIKQEIIRKFK